MINEEEEFKDIERFLSQNINESGNFNFDRASQELIFDSLVDRQVTLMTGSRFLVNMRKEFESLILQAAKESGFNVYVERIAYSTPVIDKLIPLDGLIGVYTWDIKKNHLGFWNKFDEIKEREKAAFRKLFE